MALWMGRWGYNLSGAITLHLVGAHLVATLRLPSMFSRPLSPPKYQLPGHEWKTNQWQFRQTSRWTRAKHLLRGILFNKQGAGQRTQRLGQNGVIIHQPELKGTFQKPDTMALKPSEKFKISYFHSPSSPDHAGFPVPRLGTPTCTLTTTKRSTAF